MPFAVFIMLSCMPRKRIFYPNSVHGKLSLLGSCTRSNNPRQEITGEGSCLVSQEKKRTNDLLLVGGNVLSGVAGINQSYIGCNPRPHTILSACLRPHSFLPDWPVPGGMLRPIFNPDGY